MLMLDCVIKQAVELRAEVRHAALDEAHALHFDRALTQIEARALKLFARLV